MLKSAHIENYQSHRKTVMEFQPGVNVIIGDSDAGKSAVFRAINWVCSNRPLGDDFRSEWGGDTTVALHTVEGDVVQRTRTASKNEYSINGRKLEAFGHGVPEEVKNILQVDTPNIQAQMDPPFLLSSTPGEAARLLNKAASIDDIDHTTSGLKSTHDKIKTRIKYDKTQLEENQKKMKQYEDIPALEEKLQKAEELEGEREEKEGALRLLRDLTRRTITVGNRLKETDRIPGLLQKCVEAEKEHILYQQGVARHSKYVAAVKRAAGVQKELETTKYVTRVAPVLEEAENEFSAFKEKTKQTTEIKLILRKAKETGYALWSTDYIEQAAPLLLKAEELFSEWGTKKRQKDELKQLVTRGQRAAAALKKVQKAAGQLEQEFHELAPEFCPLCGSRMLEGEQRE